MSDCVSREFMYKLGARCIAVRNENGELVALTSIESLPSVESERPKWIPVNEHLPEKGGRYLTYIINPIDSRLQYMMICDYFILKNSHSWCPDDETASNHVVAWMPLPEPYKEGV